MSHLDRRAARELLILPRLDAALPKSAWLGLVDLSLPQLPALDTSHLPDSWAKVGAESVNAQSREDFSAEAHVISRKQKSLKWRAPSRDENTSGPLLRAEETALWAGSLEDQQAAMVATTSVQGGRERGLILHKLVEEVLTGETDENEKALSERAATLIRALNKVPVDDPAAGLCADEMARSVLQTLTLPDVSSLRPLLVPELPVYALCEEGAGVIATAGVADAVAVGRDGRPIVIVDWKSDVNPDAQTLEHYRSQVSTYLDMTGAERGLIVLMTHGTVITVVPSLKTAA